MKIILNNSEYELIKEYKDAFVLDEVIGLATDYFNDFDYILGDYAYNKLRKKAFMKTTIKKQRKLTNIVI